MTKRLINILFALLLILTPVFIINGGGNYKAIASGVNSAEIVIDSLTNRVVYSKNENAKLPMASTTKILTAITVIENTDIEKEVVITEKTVGVEGSSIYLEVGEKLKIIDLLYGLMLRSGNDCAETLAYEVSGSIDKFAELMNKTAKNIGAFNSNFVNPHGLPNDNHYTTAYDLAIISSYAMKNETFRKIVGTKSIKIPHTTREYDRVLVNKNKMLSGFDGANGIKTGYTKKAGRCLVASAKRNNTEFISVVLNCQDMWERSKDLLNQAFEKYKEYKVMNSDNVVDFVKIKKTDENIGAIIKNDVYLCLTKEEKDSLEIKIDLPSELEVYEKDKEIGKVDFYALNNLIFSEKIYTI